MMSWSPTPRRNAVSGLANLWSCEKWRLSEHSEEIRQRLVDVVADGDPVVRLYAACVTPILGKGGGESLDLLESRLLAEPHPDVAAELMRRLAKFRDSLHNRTDAVLAAVLQEERWQAVMRARTSDDRADAVGDLVLYLALRWEKPAATSLLDSWSQAPSDTEVAMCAVSQVRSWLQLGADRSQERARAFDFLKRGAAALEQSRAASQDGKGAVREVHRCADAMVSAIYFASGGHVTGDQPARKPDPEFAREAFGVLSLLTGFKNPSTVHHVVETLAYLAPVDPVRALLLVQDWVKSGDAYTYDPLGSATLIGLIERYLAEFRDHLSSSAELLTAVHSLLDAFVRVGWPEGVALTYRLGEAFR